MYEWTHTRLHAPIWARETIGLLEMNPHFKFQDNPSSQSKDIPLKPRNLSAVPERSRTTLANPTIFLTIASCQIHPRFKSQENPSTRSKDIPLKPHLKPRNNETDPEGSRTTLAKKIPPTINSQTPDTPTFQI